MAKKRIYKDVYITIVTVSFGFGNVETKSKIFDHEPHGMDIESLVIEAEKMANGILIGRILVHTQKAMEDLVSRYGIGSIIKPREEE